MEKNYKDTLNLPKTSFSMKANLIQLELKILKRWEEMNIYEKLKSQRKDAEKFILHDGPPYANGRIHIGHALNKILKDIVVKYKIQRGFKVPFIIGWDCHGLPVEHQLFKELNLTKHDVDIREFRKKAREFALSHVNLQRDDFKKLGLFCDWEQPYLTFDPEYEYNVIKLLEYLADKGYIYRGRKPVNWCVECETALAEAEVEYLDKESESIYFLFEVVDHQNVFSREEKNPVYFLVWTTTPWTLISNVAVALSPDFEYCLARFNEKTVVLGKDLIPSLEEKFGVKFQILRGLKGKELESLKLKHPFLEREAIVVLADFVSNQEGSGCVHVAPGHGQDDFSLTKKYSLSVIMSVDERGIFQEPMEFKGLDIAAVNIKVINELKNKQKLIKHQKINHAYPHCWRCRKPIIFRATFQWFLNIEHENLREKLLKELDRVEWVPPTGKERMRGMLISRPDWCLSRQRLWGIPIPAVKCKFCSQVALDKDIISIAADLFRKKGSDVWFTAELDEFLPREYKCSACGGKEFIKEYDILDVWFESGASFFSVVKPNEQLRFPADMYLEGSDQHRGWFQVSLISSMAKENIAPFKTILTHGFVVDGEGKKMSKSLGNVISPQEISNKYGAEILRLWSAYSDYTEDVRISEGIIKQLVDMYRKIRNTIRFILGNLYDFDFKNSEVTYPRLLEVDKFMLAKTMNVFKEVISCYDHYAFYKAAQNIFNFCNLDLSSFYLDFLKDRLYTFSAASKERRSAQFALHCILDVLLKMIAPILSFTAEEAYLCWENAEQRKDSVFSVVLEDSFKEDWIDNSLLLKWDKIIKLRGEILKEMEKKREKGEIGSSLEAEVFLTFNDEDYGFFENYKDSLREILIVSQVSVERGNFKIEIKQTGHEKCLRCWNRRKDVGEDRGFPQVCSRCRDVLKLYG